MTVRTFAEQPASSLAERRTKLKASQAALKSSEERRESGKVVSNDLIASELAAVCVALG